ncbi:MAG: reverse transcriptase domain-containing protein [Promethearchaeota archaeon]
MLEKIGMSPFRHKIKMWLKSRAISEVGFETTGKGTPQGGVISPLLANRALDGIERLFGIYTASGNYKSPSRRSRPNKDVSLIRYADDFIWWPHLAYN